MQTLTLAHRDNDRTPVILAIREIATTTWMCVRFRSKLRDLHWVKELDRDGFIENLINFPA